MKKILAICFIISVFGHAAHGAYPERKEAFVNDYAGLLTLEHKAHIRQAFSDLKKDKGIEAEAVTIGSIADYGTGDTSIETFSTNFFNTWRIGTVPDNKGLLLLVAYKDRKMRIEVGSGFKGALNVEMEKIIDEIMVPKFKLEQYSLGILEGAQAVTERLSTKRAAALGDFLADKAARNDPLDQLDRFINIKTLGIAIGFTIGFLYFIVWAKKNKGKCPQCGSRSLKTRSRIVKRATSSSTGRKKEIKNCPHCSYHAENILILPIFVYSDSSSSDSSSDSSSSSSDGGSSSGDGASGSW